MKKLNVMSVHSAFGANAHFALGLNGSGGGFALEKSHVQNQDVFIGYVEDQDIYMLPYFDQNKKNPSLAFVKDYCINQNKKRHILKDVNRELTITDDSISAGKITASLVTPYQRTDDIKDLDTETLKCLIAPVVYVRITIDNRKCSGKIQGFFAIGDMNGKYFFSKHTGIASREGYSFATDEKSAAVFGDFDIVSAFSKKVPQPFPLAPVGGIYFDVEANELKTVDIALSFYKAGQVTYGSFELPYLYTNYFNNIEEVSDFALLVKDKQYKVAKQTDEIMKQITNKNELFLYAQSIKSYFASTMLFGDLENYKYVVNEGSYMMLNTCDLFVDHIFFELYFSPFVVKNQLQQYINDYRYYDQLEVEGKMTEGGISFAHDMGVFNVFSEKGTSSYEIKDQLGCYSFMTAEELMNVIVGLAMYVKKTNDLSITDNSLIKELLTSLERRDHPEVSKRIGGINFDSSKCENGEEITTYDSLDHSLGFTRGSLYIASKCMASFLALSYLLDKYNEPKAAKEAKNGADLSANLLLGMFDETTNTFPATIHSETKTPIIPIIEPLIYPFYLEQWTELIAEPLYHQLHTYAQLHVTNILQKGICLFDDYGYKLSKSSINSWMSKIFLCQFVAEKVLKNERALKIKKKSTRAHMNWWIDGCSSNPAIDQIFNGSQDERNFFYPRSVTSFLNIVFAEKEEEIK